MVSAIVGVVSTVGAILCLRTTELRSDPGCGYKSECEWALGLCAGYMLYDLIHSYNQYGLTGFPTMIIHHVNIFVVFVAGLVYKTGYFYMAAYMTNEISQPFFHL
eukprot:CAMPEP_0196663702 /NCGR_PEP_ID=MMETSP1086-20130531/53892_1 /TAXON_ID=77921 /ORGANISM="Cyanoptyche  gloeocystis , Strain SAG4.97" /LENGTH=104 /DNA_ID=CAMNT_0041999621 /DNA_START=360 /DNA_END=670 /DNA_ORIENTATION=+